MPVLLQVALGGAIGATLRYISVTMVARLVAGFPLGTMLVNVVGSFVMGVLAIWVLEKTDARYAPLLMTGILGGFTTFSAYSLDAIKLIEQGKLGGAAFYIVGTVILAIAGLMLGMFVARTIS